MENRYRDDIAAAPRTARASQTAARSSAQPQISAT